jgi:tripartite-type tricarboxylate transporter receptor subunit TctC
MKREGSAMRRLFARAVLAVLALLPTASLGFPDRPPRIVSGFAAGGGSDTLSRFVAEAISPAFGQRVTVENRTGVNGVIGAEVVARSAPDGYVAFQCPMSTLAITPQLEGASLPLDPGAELLPVANVALSSYVLVVAAGSPFRGTAELLAAARARPGQITFASPGPGSAQHLSGELVKRLAGVDMQHIPYRGAAPAALDIIAGRVDFMITNAGDVARQVQDGALRILAQGDATRLPAFPDLPRLADTLPGFDVTGWFGICLPRGTLPAVVARWDEAIRAAMAEGTLARRLQEAGFTPLYEGPEPFAQRLARDRATWREVIRAGAVRAQ